MHTVLREIHPSYYSYLTHGCMLNIIMPSCCWIYQHTIARLAKGTWEAVERLHGVSGCFCIIMQARHMMPHLCHVYLHTILMFITSSEVGIPIPSPSQSSVLSYHVLNLQNSIYKIQRASCSARGCLCISCKDRHERYGMWNGME